MRVYRYLAWSASVLALLVVALGAYVRLTDAGLGCPDWPGCYGHWLGVPQALHEQVAAAEAYPDRPVDAGRAWREMTHRYVAALLGILVLILFLMAWSGWRQGRQFSFSRGVVVTPLWPTILLLLVIFQALLGMWTVTLLLKPIVVTAHLLGGMSVLALLVCEALQVSRRLDRTVVPQGYGLKIWAALALLLVFCQIALGGWVSSNYAALACPDFPTCQGRLWPPLDWGQAFSLHRELGRTGDGALLSYTALVSIHWAHRVGALLLLLVLGGLSVFLVSSARYKALRIWGVCLLLALATQILLGIGNVIFALPLWLAVAHTVGAAFVLVVSTALNCYLLQPRRFY